MPTPCHESAELPLTVYLDSSDFSTLSDPRRTSHQEAIRSQLVTWADSHQVSFVFSGVHLMEMAPCAPSDTAHATARADLLVRLCGRNAVISIDRLVKAEAKRLATCSAQRPQVLSASADWYPDLGQLFSPVKWLDTLKEELGEASKQQGLNRKQRRALKRNVVGSRGLKPAAKHLLGSWPDEARMREMLKLYPMRDQDMEVLWRYSIGRASAADANEAFLASLRDPTWMMQWFAEHHGQLSPFIESLRRPSETIANIFREFAGQAKRFYATVNAIGTKPRTTILAYGRWRAFGDELLCNIARNVAERAEVELPAQVSAVDVKRYCPGLAAAFLVLHSVMRDVATAHPRSPKESDFADAIHSMYAPYVNLFRADSYMAPRVAAVTAAYGTSVVAKLSFLVAGIETGLKRRGGMALCSEPDCT